MLPAVFRRPSAGPGKNRPETRLIPIINRIILSFRMLSVNKVSALPRAQKGSSPARLTGQKSRLFYAKEDRLPWGFRLLIFTFSVRRRLPAGARETGYPRMQKTPSSSVLPDQDPAPCQREKCENTSGKDRKHRPDHVRPKSEYSEENQHDRQHREHVHE